MIQTQLLNDSSLHSNDLGIKIEDSAKVELVQAELGAKMDYVGCMALLSGYCAEFAADTIYYGDEKRKDRPQLYCKTYRQEDCQQYEG